MNDGDFSLKLGTRLTLYLALIIALTFSVYGYARIISRREVLTQSMRLEVRSLAEALEIKSQYWLLGDRAVLSNLKAIVNRAEAIAQEAARLLELGICLENSTMAEVARLDAAIAEVSEGAISSLITRDIARANQVIESIRRLEDDAETIEDGLSETIQSPLCRSLILRVIHGFCEIVSRHRTIAEIAINRGLEESGDHASIDAGFFSKS